MMGMFFKKVFVFSALFSACLNAWAENYATGPGSVATSNNDDSAVAVGINNNASASGYFSPIYHNQAVSFGINNNANASSSIASGGFNSQTVAFGINNNASVSDSELPNYSEALDNNMAVAFGVNNNASASNSVAIGIDSQALGVESLSMGYRNISNGRNTITIGQENRGFTSSILIGGNNSGAGDIDGKDEQSIAIGYGNWVHGPFAIAHGVFNWITARNSIGIGLSNNIYSEYSSALGNRNDISGSFSHILGFKNKINHLQKVVVLGNNNMAEKRFGANNSEMVNGNSAVVGNDNNVKIINSMVVGNKNTIFGEDTMVFGNYNNITDGAEGGVITIGNNNRGSVSVNKTVIIGENIIASASNAVVLGHDSRDGGNNTVSVGSYGNLRKIVFVNDGDISATSKDAINGSQIYSILQNGDGINVNNWKSLLNIPTTINTSDGNNQPSTTPTSDEIMEAKTIAETAQSEAKMAKYEASIAKQWANEAKNEVAIAKTNIADLSNNVSTMQESISSQGQQIQNLSQRIADNTNKINTVSKDASAGIASAVAIGSLPTSNEPGGVMFAMAGGSYDGQSAMALGLSKRTDNGKFSFKANVSANTRGKVAVGAGVGYLWR